MATRLIAIVGPTASGKSDAALRLCEARNGEIVSCDSLQVYCGFEIGSAKPTPAERARVRHHLLDVADARDAFTAARYAALAREAVRAIAAAGKLAVVVGGTGLYLRALLRGLSPAPARDEALRKRLVGLAERHGDERLWRHLRRVDPSAAACIEPRDRVRVVRALEIYLLTGRPMSDQQAAGEEPLAGFAPRRFVLDPGQTALRAAVERRTASMLQAGLVEETRRLLERYGPVRALEAIGYRQAAAHLRMELTSAELPRAIVTATMQYAKRQRTWFRHQEPEALWFTNGAALFSAACAWLDEDAA